MSFNPKDFGLKKDYLYEILATTFSINHSNDEIIPNTACMGIRLIENDLIMIGPYPNTTTLRNLKDNGFVSINFVGNIHLYAMAALKEKNSSIKLTEFPKEYYSYKKVDISSEYFLELTEISMPYINKAWGVLFCKAIEEHQTSKKDALGELQISEFNLKVISCEKLKGSFKLFNRAENLVLETIILATRLKLAKDRKDKNLFIKLNQQILDYVQNIERFGGNKNALKALDVVKKYVSRLKI